MTVTNVTPPVITGTAKQGQTLHTSNGTWTYDLEVLSYTYRWLRCDSAGANCVAIGGATSSGYLLTSADVGHRLRSEVTATEHSGTPLPPESGPMTITTGGTYLVNVVSPDTTTAITIATTQPVTITGSVKNEHGGHLIDAESAGATQVTLDHLFAYGGYPYTNSGRLFRAFAFKSFVMEHCTIEATRGVELQEPVAASTVRIRYNRHHNIQGFNNPAGDTDVGNFVQMRILQNATIEIAWNEIVNEYNQSEPTDIMNIYFTRNAHIHDNYLQHQSRVGNATPSSQNSITSEGDSRMNNLLIEDNQVVDAYGIGLHQNMGMGSNNSLLNNRIVADQYLPNGDPKANGLGAPLFIATGGTNNHAHGNVVGYIDASGTKTDFNLAGAPEGAAGEAANNTSMPLPINSTTEDNEWTIWQTKLTDNGITIGA